MTPFKKGIAIVLAGGFLTATCFTFAFPQGAVTLVQLVLGGALVSNSNPLPVSTTSNTPVSPGAATATTGTLAGEQYSTTLPSPTNGQQLSVQAGPQGDLFVSSPGQTVPNFSITTSNNTVTTGKSIGGLITITNAARVSGTAGNPGTGVIPLSNVPEQFPRVHSNMPASKD